MQVHKTGVEQVQHMWQDVRNDETKNEADNETDVEQTESENEQDVGDEASNEKQE